MGDADLRHVSAHTAEFALMIGERSVQGRGIGTRFATLIHAFAYQVLSLETLYVSIIPANSASRRLFEKLGYVADDSREARAFADEDDDLTLSLSRATFEQRHTGSLAALSMVERP
jgi:RimJ/RimL family protein N-acetyltransferase